MLSAAWRYLPALSFGLAPLAYATRAVAIATYSTERMFEIGVGSIAAACLCTFAANKFRPVTASALTYCGAIGTLVAWVVPTSFDFGMNALVVTIWGAWAFAVASVTLTSITSMRWPAYLALVPCVLLSTLCWLVAIELCHGHRCMN